MLDQAVDLILQHQIMFGDAQFFDRHGHVLVLLVLALFRVVHFRQIADGRVPVQFFQQDIVSSALFVLIDAAFENPQVAENDRICGTALLTGGLDLAVVDRTALVACKNLLLLDPLDAESSIFPSRRGCAR